MKLFGVVTALSVLLAYPAVADLPRPQGCAPYIQVAAGLQATYGESVIDEMFVRDREYNVLMQLWANPESMSWTITGHVPGEPMICIFASGDDYHGVSLAEFVSEDA